MAARQTKSKADGAKPAARPRKGAGAVAGAGAADPAPAKPAKTAKTAKAAPKRTAAAADTAADRTAARPAGKTDAATALRRKDLVDLVAADVALSRSAVRPVVDATLRRLGEALGADRPVSIPELGRARVNRRKGGAKGETLTIKLRRKTHKPRPAEPDEALAAADE